MGGNDRERQKDGCGYTNNTADAAISHLILPRAGRSRLNLLTAHPEPDVPIRRQLSRSYGRWNLGKSEQKRCRLWNDSTRRDNQKSASNRANCRDSWMGILRRGSKRWRASTALLHSLVAALGKLWNADNHSRCANDKQSQR